MLLPSQQLRLQGVTVDLIQGGESGASSSRSARAESVGRSTTQPVKTAAESQKTTTPDWYEPDKALGGFDPVKGEVINAPFALSKNQKYMIGGAVALLLILSLQR